MVSYSVDEFGRIHVKMKHKTSKQIKIGIQKGKQIYYYDLNGDQKEEIYPLQMGNGKYTLSVNSLIKDHRYKVEQKKTFYLDLSNPNLPFLFPNQFVNYSRKDLPPEIDSIKAAKKFMTKCVYDYVRAVQLAPKGFCLPDLYYALTKKRGICQDYAALFAAFCRNINVPARILFGRVDNYYHTWCEYYYNDEWIMYDPTAVIMKRTPQKYYPAERYY